MRVGRITYRSIALVVLGLMAWWSVMPKFRGQHDLADTRSSYMMLVLLGIIAVDGLCFKALPSYLDRRKRTLNG